jgi:hypothetical protein
MFDLSRDTLKKCRSKWRILRHVKAILPFMKSEDEKLWAWRERDPEVPYGFETSKNRHYILELRAIEKCRN